MRSPQCSTSTTAGQKAAGSRTNMAAAKTSTPSLSCGAPTRRFTGNFRTRPPRGGVDRLADGVTAGRMGRARLRLQVEHGLDARHARVHLQGPDLSPASPRQHLFGLHYAFSENFILPLSHDEVVHGKRSILGRMPGDEWQRFANLRAYYSFMFGHPGKKLMFMGANSPRTREWNHDISLPWHLLAASRHMPVCSASCATSTASIGALPALHALDCEAAGFEWLVADDSTTACSPGCERDTMRASVAWSSSISPRKSCATTASACPFAGRWREVLNTDAAIYGGSNIGNAGAVSTVVTRDTRSFALLSHPLLPSFSFLKTVTATFGRAPHPLGATWNGRGTNFALFSANATKVELCLFDREARETERLSLPERTDDVWHVYLVARRSRPALRLSCSRAVPAESRPSFQSPQAADRSVSKGAGQASCLERSAFRL